ncbi:unnamed protein product [Durusdinium trenchii]
MKDPIIEVSARYGEDGYCVFGSFSDDLRTCAISRSAKNPSYYASAFQPIYADVLNHSGATPVTLNFYDGRTLLIRDHSSPHDDLYCYTMGWYDLPWETRFAVVKNLTFLEEFSEETCEKLSKTIPNYLNIAMFDLRNETAVIDAFLVNLEMDGGGKVPEWVVGNMYLHAAAKCLLGGNRGALCDIANCAQRGCFGEDKTTLLYTVRGECPSPLSG